jgi:hypothetical protein
LLSAAISRSPWTTRIVTAVWLVDERGRDAAERFDAKGQRRDVEQKHILHVALQDAGLDRRARSDHLVRINATVRLLAEQVLDRLDDLGHARHAANQNDLLDLAGRDAGVLERRLDRPDRPLDKVINERLQLGPGQFDVEVLGPALIGGDEGQVDFGLSRRRQLDLGLLGCFLQALQCEPIRAQIDSLLLLELFGQIVDHAFVEVLAAQEGVAVGGLHLEDAVADLEDRNVEGPAAQVVDRDRTATALLEPVGERGRSRLIDDAQHLEAGNFAGVLGRLALGIIEIGGHRNDRLGDRLAQVALHRFLHFLEHESGDLRRAVLLALGFDPGVAVVGFYDLVRDQVLVLLGQGIVEAAPDQPLDREQSVLGVGDRLTLGRLADQPFARIRERDHRRRRACTLGVFDDLGVLPLHDRNTGVGRAEVDSDYLAHSPPRVLANRPGGLMR